MISVSQRTGAGRGLVIAAHQAAADAGAAALAARGSAVDAAVAAGFALCVVDPANCGVGGYGGFLTYAPPVGRPVRVDFNTWVPDRVEASRFTAPGDHTARFDGGAAVAPAAVVPGLVAAQERFGTLPLADVVAPAIRLARGGFAVGRDLGGAFEQHWQRTSGGSREFASIFFPGGRVPGVGARLVQPDLARTLEAVAAGGAAPLRSGGIVEAICAEVRSDGGFLDADDFLRDTVGVGDAASVAFETASIYGPPRETSGAGVLFSALERLELSRLGSNRDGAYVAELARALTDAWRERAEVARTALQARHTTNLCTADADGGLVALTFTHGSLSFGSGLVAPGTGVVLNAGANLFATSSVGPRAVTNMTPVVIEQADGLRHALGGTGGPRIPGILFTAVIDVVHFGLSLAAALAAPHLSVRALDGALEVEPELLEAAGHGLPIGTSEFGPAAGITWMEDRCVAAIDPRFETGVAVA